MKWRRWPILWMDQRHDFDVYNTEQNVIDDDDYDFTSNGNGW